MPTDRQKARELFLHAVGKLPTDQWDGYVAEVCSEDADLAQQLECLLQVHREAGNFLDVPAWSADAALEPWLQERPGAKIGPYMLRELLGEGGMGNVFVAEQEEPVRRKVALKIIKPGMDSRQVLARFDAERQALALMDHPNIAKVLDAGVTEGGRPYFVMELVRGVPITEFCDQGRLGPRQRLEIFVQVCRAIQHAHQKGIIHRDVKPTNVLVTLHDELAVPKVIDFGIAKATGQRLTEQTVYTAFSQMIGTPLYMSPEQAEMNALDVDTRSDVYSLGVLLYELLTGATPFDGDELRQAGFDEMRRLIREVDPPRPSARVSTLDAPIASTVSQRRGVDERRLGGALRGDLDWIVMKALEKDRNRRYETASAMAADIQHYLANEPVSAAAPSRAYRFRKFALRNKGPAIAVAALLLGLVGLAIGATIGLVSQSQQREIAERERAEAKLHLAVALQSQRKYAAAEELYRHELQISSGDTSADRQRNALTRMRLAQVVNDRSGARESEQLHREALAAYRAAFPPGDPNIAHVLTNLALVLRPQQRFDEAEPLFREVYEIHRRAAPADHRAIGESAANLANVLITLGRHAEAEPLAREAIAEHVLAVPQDAWALAFARLELGRVLLAMGNYPEAEAQFLAAERVLRTTDEFHLGALALAGLYTKWDESQPDEGYDAQAQQWVRQLIGMFVPPETATIEAKKSD